ncbi:MAG: site-specific integrase [Nitrospinota bacterium]|nr:site-specific integrase [Nitrospinota bacterium]
MYKKPGGSTYHITIRYQGKFKKINLGTSSKREAEKIAIRIKAQIAEGKFFGFSKGANKTFSDLAREYLKDYSTKKSHKSQLRDEGIFKNHLLPFFGDFILRFIEPSDIQKYKINRSKIAGSLDTVNKELTLLKTCLNVALKELEWIEKNPAEAVKKNKPGKSRIRFLEEWEIQALYEASPEWLKNLIIGARHSGLRRGNLLELKWSQVNLFKRWILIGKTKNGEPLGIPIFDEFHDILLKLSKLKHIRSDYIFAEPDGKKIHESKLRKAWLTALDRTSKPPIVSKSPNNTGIENLRWHDLRHDFASRLVQAGVDLYVVKELLGHKDIKETQKYAHLAPSNLMNAVEIMRNLPIGKNSAPHVPHIENPKG